MVLRNPDTGEAVAVPIRYVPVRPPEPDDD